MKITFVLPDYCLTPIGGFRIVYLYADELQQRGHEVTLVFPDLARSNPLLWVLRAHLLRRMRPEWYEFRTPVRRIYTQSFRPSRLPDADVVIATGVQTAYPVAQLPREKGLPFYLVQGREDWAVGEQRLLESWRLPVRKLVIAQWLSSEIASVVADPSTEIAYLPNPFESDMFFTTTAPKSRHDPHLLMLWSPGRMKRAADGIAAAEAARRFVPNLRATFFGTVRRPSALPKWIAYQRGPCGPQLRQLYNSGTIFLHTSSAEGSPLPPAEAMACGCAVVATRNRGALEYLTERNAYLVDVADTDQMAEGIALLAQDQSVRLSLVQEGLRTVDRRTVGTATNHLLEVLKADLEDLNEKIF